MKCFRLMTAVILLFTASVGRADESNDASTSDAAATPTETTASETTANETETLAVAEEAESSDDGEKSVAAQREEIRAKFREAMELRRAGKSDEAEEILSGIREQMSAAGRTGFGGRVRKGGFGREAHGRKNIFLLRWRSQYLFLGSWRLLRSQICGWDWSTAKRGVHGCCGR